MTINILTLDDSSADRDFIVNILNANDQLHVTGFWNADEFKQSITNDIGLIITDVRVPGYDVFDMISYIHNNFPGIYIIVISGYFNDDIYAELFELGVDRVVQKKGNMAWAEKVSKYVDDLLPKILAKKELMT